MANSPSASRSPSASPSPSASRSPSASPSPSMEIGIVYRQTVFMETQTEKEIVIGYTRIVR